MVNSPLTRPAISLGKRGIGGVPLGSHDKCPRLRNFLSPVEAMLDDEQTQLQAAIAASLDTMAIEVNEVQEDFFWGYCRVFLKCILSWVYSN